MSNNKVENLELAIARILKRLLPFPKKTYNLETDFYDICEHAHLELNRFDAAWLRRYNLPYKTLDEFLEEAVTLQLIKRENEQYYLTYFGKKNVEQVRQRRRKVEEKYDKVLHDEMKTSSSGPPAADAPRQS